MEREKGEKHQNKEGKDAGAGGKEQGEDDWTEVRKKGERRKETNVYVSNLPLRFTSTCLWKAFAKTEGLSDAYVPVKMNELGRRFGFLRFRNVRSETALIQSINNSRIEGNRIQANISRYSRDSKSEFIKKASSEGHYGGRRETHKTHNMAQRIPIGTNNDRTTGRSYREVLQGGRSVGSENLTIFLGNNAINGFANLVGRAFVGTVRDLNTLTKLDSLMQEWVKVATTIRYIGGLKVLLSFQNQEEAKIFEEGKQEG